MCACVRVRVVDGLRGGRKNVNLRGKEAKRGIRAKPRVRGYAKKLNADMPKIEKIRTGYFLSRSMNPRNPSWGTRSPNGAPRRTGGEDERVEGAGRERHSARGARDRDGDEAVRIVRVKVSVDQRLGRASGCSDCWMHQDGKQRERIRIRVRIETRADPSSENRAIAIMFFTLCLGNMGCGHSCRILGAVIPDR